jgi:hypothetical protein
MGQCIAGIILHSAYAVTKEAKGHGNREFGGRRNGEDEDTMELVGSWGAGGDGVLVLERGGDSARIGDLIRASPVELVLILKL